MHDFCIVDTLNAAGFSTLGSRPRLFHRFTPAVDSQGRHWAVAETGSGRFAVTTAGPNRLFDPELTTTPAAVDSQDPEQDPTLVLETVVSGLRLDEKSERLLWSIHAEVLRRKLSVVDLPDKYLAEIVWGRRERPKNWRSYLRRYLGTLTRLHYLSTKNVDRPFDFNSAVLLSASSLQTTPEDVCAGDCVWYGQRRHHHFRINVGGGFLGALEQFAEDENLTVRAYRFPEASRRRMTTTLSNVGRTGRIGKLYLPAKIGNIDVCKTFTVSQRRLLQALIHETTRDSRSNDASGAAVSTGRMVVGAYLSRTLPCPFLEADQPYIGFNGNRVRRGMGYLLASPGGWQNKSGYELAATRDFLADLRVLQNRLSIVPVGFAPASGDFLSLSRICALAENAASRSSLDRVHLRVYAPADYLTRWRTIFTGPDATAASTSMVVSDGIDLRLRTVLAARGTKTRMCRDLDIDPSFLTKVLAGIKPLPTGMRDRILHWINEHGGNEEFSVET